MIDIQEFFRAIGLIDKSSEACIYRIEQLISIFSCLERNLKGIINHIRSDAGSEFISIMLENGVKSGKSWCDTLDLFLKLELGFKKSSVEICFYIYRDDKDWIKMTNYVDDASYYVNYNQLGQNFEK